MGTGELSIQKDKFPFKMNLSHKNRPIGNKYAGW
jgi:hypothetical protein